MGQTPPPRSRRRQPPTAESIAYRAAVFAAQSFGHRLILSRTLRDVAALGGPFRAQMMVATLNKCRHYGLAASA